MFLSIYTIFRGVIFAMLSFVTKPSSTLSSVSSPSSSKIIVHISFISQDHKMLVTCYLNGDDDNASILDKYKREPGLSSDFPYFSESVANTQRFTRSFYFGGDSGHQDEWASPTGMKLLALTPNSKLVGLGMTVPFKAFSQLTCPAIIFIYGIRSDAEGTAKRPLERFTPVTLSS